MLTCVIRSTAECYAIILHIYNLISRIALLQTFEFFSSHWPPGKWTTPKKRGTYFVADENQPRLRHDRQKRYERYVICVFKYSIVMYNLCSTHCWFRAFRENFSQRRTTYKLLKWHQKHLQLLPICTILFPAGKNAKIVAKNCIHCFYCLFHWWRLAAQK